MKSPLSLTLDERTLRELDTLSQSEGIAPSEMAARLLRRTVRGKARFLRKMGKLTQERFADVQDALLTALGL